MHRRVWWLGVYEYIMYCVRAVYERTHLRSEFDMQMDFRL
jgi:hypothetical protein